MGLPKPSRTPAGPHPATPPGAPQRASFRAPWACQFGAVGLLNSLFAILVTTFFQLFFKPFFHQFWYGPVLIRFPPQLGPQNQPKPLKKSIPTGNPSWIGFFVDFLTMLAPNFYPQIFKNQAPAAARARIFKIRLSKVASIFFTILVPAWLYFAYQNPRKYFFKINTESNLKNDGF